jgi:CheY-like chemotaxis protein
MAGELASGRVLVVDDDPHVRDMVRAALTTIARCSGISASTQHRCTRAFGSAAEARGVILRGESGADFERVRM